MATLGNFFFQFCEGRFGYILTIYDSNGIGLGTMGVECADYDNDGRLDFFMTSYQKQWAIVGVAVVVSVVVFWSQPAINAVPATSRGIIFFFIYKLPLVSSEGERALMPKA